MNEAILIFDFDGTIADTLHYILDISNKLSAEFKFKKIDPQEVDTLKDFNVHQTIQHLHVPILKIPLILAKAKKELHKEIESVEPIEGLKEILLQLKSLGYVMGIMTTNSVKNVNKFLNNHDLDLFDFINTTSKIWDKNKALKNIINKQGFDLKKVLYIGDETRDIEAAKKAGIKIAAVTWGYNSSKALKACNPDFIVDRPEDLIELCAGEHSNKN